MATVCEFSVPPLIFLGSARDPGLLQVRGIAAMSDIDSSSTTTDETRLLSHISEADEFTSEIDQTSEHGEHRGRLFSETAVTEEKSEVEAEETERFAEDNLAPGVGAAPQEFETEESKVPSQQDVGGSEEEIKPDLGDAREEIKPEPLGQETIHDSVAKPADEFVDPQEDSRADQQEGKPLTGPGGHEMSHYELFTSSSESIGTLVDAVKLRKCNPDQVHCLSPCRNSKLCLRSDPLCFASGSTSLVRQGDRSTRSA